MPPSEFREIGTEEHPIHASRLDALLACPWGFIGGLFAMYDDAVGEPAHTGTACARVIELWQLGRELADAIRQARVEAFTGPRPFALADWSRVECLCGAYAADGRNRREEVLAVEEKHVGEVVPGLWVVGVYDQLRRLGNARQIWDVKAGRRPPEAREYLCQLAAYALLTGAEVGGLIALRDYETRELGPVFRGVHLPRPAAVALLEGVAAEVVRLRRGEVYARPGLRCAWCGFGGPEQCLPLLAASTGPDK